MGVTDEHWCSDCGRGLDKRKDKYLEVDWINYHKLREKQAKRKGEKYTPPEMPKHSRAFICQECLNKYPFIQRVFGKLRLVGNPNFNVSIVCSSTDKCKNYEHRNEQVNCKHIAVINDKIYCKRRHPKYVTLYQEKSKIEKEQMKWVAEYFGAFAKKLGFKGGFKAFEKIISGDLKMSVLDNLKYTPTPEIVVGQSHPHLEGGIPKVVLEPKDTKKAA